MKPLEPLRGLQHNRERWLNKRLIDIAAIANSRLIGKRASSLEAALNCHQAKFLRNFVWIQRLETEQSALFQKKQSIGAQFRKRRGLGSPVQQKRNEIVGDRTHAGILMIDNTQAVIVVDHEISGESRDDRAPAAALRARRK